MELAIPDYVLLTIALIGAIIGLFMGFSGALGFLSGCVAAAVVGYFGWSASAGFLEANWSRGLATLVATLLAFGLARFIVRKLVHGLVAQPGDAIFGFLVSGLTAFALAASAWLLARHLGLVETTVNSVLLQGLLSGGSLW